MKNFRLKKETRQKIDEIRLRINRLIPIVIYIMLAVAGARAMLVEENYLKAICFLLLIILMEIGDLNPRNKN